MNINYTFRKIRSTDALKEHIEKKVEKFFKYVNYAMEIHVLLSVEKLSQLAEITCHAEHRDLVAQAKSKDLYESIDLVCHKIENQLKKERERRKGHTSGHAKKKLLKLGQDVQVEIPHKEKRL